VRPSDPSRLADALLRLYHEPALRSKLGAAGCAAARAGYGADAVISQVEALYTRLARPTSA
jgi:glycosyltransferase involved in cell wall biosynthesis